MADFLLLHGALGSVLDLKHIEIALQARGHKSHVIQLDPMGTEAIPSMAQKLEYEINKYDQPVHVIGYSMGGYVALFLAAQHPRAMASLTTLAVKLNWSKEGVEQERRWMLPEIIEEKFPALKLSLQNTHGEGWTSVLRHTVQMMDEIATHHYVNASLAQTIRVQTTLLVGDLDKMVSIAETQQLADCMPHGTCKILAGVKHPVQTWKGQGLSWLDAEV